MVVLFGGIGGSRGMESVVTGMDERAVVPFSFSSRLSPLLCTLGSRCGRRGNREEDEAGW